MSAWRITADPASPREDRWRELPRPVISDISGPENYIPDEPLLEAINTAIYLGQPLLVTGEPGCGKTEIGDFVAWKLGLGRAIRFDTKSTTTARDLFYSFDTIARFHSAYEAKGSVDPLRFTAFQALGRAILYANEPSGVADLLNNHPGRRRSVVLVDEIDKAPRDVPNDLLVEIENMQFYITELVRTVVASKSMRPIVVITSNSEKALPDAFLRRCVYYNQPFPDNARLREIVASRIVMLPLDSDLLSDALAVFGFLRKQMLRKRPGTAELLGFILALQAKGYEPNNRLRSDDNWREAAKVTLLKTSEDQSHAFEAFDWTNLE